MAYTLNWIMKYETAWAVLCPQAPTHSTVPSDQVGEGQSWVMPSGVHYHSQTLCLWTDIMYILPWREVNYFWSGIYINNDSQPNLFENPLQAKGQIRTGEANRTNLGAMWSIKWPDGSLLAI